jgi:hypothetical protein
VLRLGRVLNSSTTKDTKLHKGANPEGSLWSFEALVAVISSGGVQLCAIVFIIDMEDLCRAKAFTL